MRIYRDLQTVLNLVGAPGFEPGTPCSQSGFCYETSVIWLRRSSVYAGLRGGTVMVCWDMYV